MQEPKLVGSADILPLAERITLTGPKLETLEKRSALVALGLDRKKARDLEGLTQRRCRGS